MEKGQTSSWSVTGDWDFQVTSEVLGQLHRTESDLWDMTLNIGTQCQRRATLKESQLRERQWWDDPEVLCRNSTRVLLCHP